tara:strand:- start:780 stop:1193 length:414 start_codon:yes stop_codon:yes gene_type:complete
MEPPAGWSTHPTSSSELQDQEPSPEVIQSAPGKPAEFLFNAGWMLLAASWVLVLASMVLVMVFLIQDSAPETTQNLVTEVVDMSAKKVFPWLSFVPLAGATFNILAFIHNNRNIMNVWVLLGNGFTWSTLIYLQTLL